MTPAHYPKIRESQTANRKANERLQSLESQAAKSNTKEKRERASAISVWRVELILSVYRRAVTLPIGGVERAIDDFCGQRDPSQYI